MSALLCVASFILGGLTGICIMCLCFIAKAADRGQE